MAPVFAPRENRKPCSRSFIPATFCFNRVVNIPDKLIDLARAARHAAVLTGAGVSAESGVPTFRDANTGLWANFRPEELASPETAVYYGLLLSADGQRDASKDYLDKSSRAFLLPEELALVERARKAL